MGPLEEFFESLSGDDVEDLELAFLSSMVQIVSREFATSKDEALRGVSTCHPS